MVTIVHVLLIASQNDIHQMDAASSTSGIGGASGFAGGTIRRWYDKASCDFTFTDDDYFNPWLASRWIAFWVDLMLQEANGDMDLAVRVYNWGIGRARDGAMKGT